MIIIPIILAVMISFVVAIKTPIWVQAILGVCSFLGIFKADINYIERGIFFTLWICLVIGSIMGDLFFYINYHDHTAAMTFTKMLNWLVTP